MQDPSELDLERRLDAWTATQWTMGVTSELQQKVLDALRPSLTPVNPIPSQTGLFLIFLAVFLAGAAGLAAVMNKTGLHLMTAVQIGAIASILVACGMVFAGELTGQMVPGVRQVVPLGMALTSCGVAAALGLALLFPWQVSGDFVAEGWPCAAMEAGLAIPTAAVFWLMARRGAPPASAGVGATVAGLTIALTLIPLQSQCMFQQAPHLLVWHGGTALLLIGLGTAAGILRRLAS